MVCQGIYVRPESAVNAPIQLAGRTVGVQFHQGSHYATIAMLQGFLGKDEIRPVHVGPTEQRYGDEIPEKYRVQLRPDDFYLPRLRYVDPAPYSADEFERARRFMIEWDLIAPDATYDRLVANVI